MSLLQFHNSKLQGRFAIVNELTFVEMVGVRFPATENYHYLHRPRFYA